MYRFAYRDSVYGREFSEAQILWHDGRRTMLTEERSSSIEKVESLGRATARLTGVSYGTAHKIPALLMPEEVGGRLVTRLSSLVEPAKVQLRDRECYRIQGEFGDNPMKLWIDADSFLILKIEKSVPERGKSQIIEYFPIVNEDIPNALLQKRVEDEWEGIELLVPKIGDSG